MSQAAFSQIILDPIPVLDISTILLLMEFLEWILWTDVFRLHNLGSELFINDTFACVQHQDNNWWSEVLCGVKEKKNQVLSAVTSIKFRGFDFVCNWSNIEMNRGNEWSFILL